MSSSSWFAVGTVCKDCSFNIVVTQPKHKDYLWYCSNKFCKNHKGLELYDTDGYPDFAKRTNL